ncbi:DNA-dependent RNA polymerase subunit rpo22 [Squirrelpox virus]|uniref:DNA-directed RNA polymerase subunit n=1 Tax=Squirrelpox virus TaxID=240426 RepID=U3UBH6_9POXV|nr:DNA-dependent RNA polymerase subunit rpo22 [Squirrelpox virus]CCD83244.1 DNA-dependent RNA polymerase subunit rpo22 [Squirrelpox virus]
MNPYNVRYLAKILCLKAEIVRDPYAVISRDVLGKYTIETRYSDLSTRVTVTHKVDARVTVFQVFNEASVSYSPVEHDYGEPIIITAFTQSGHNRFPVSFLYVDAVSSDLFPTFSRLTPKETAVVSTMLQVDGKEQLRLPRMLETELVAKILHHPNLQLKIVRFYRRNMITGIEVADRAVVAVLE